jgi:glucosamine-6-phosphate deaminase
VTKTAELTAQLHKAPIDVALVGIGENAHIAFNDPPADFDTTKSYIIVNLNEACKAQQVREGWFPGISDVPNQAISMSVHEIMNCKKIISSVPHKVKAEAVQQTLGNELTPNIPATILKLHPDWTLFLERESASLIE